MINIIVLKIKEKYGVEYVNRLYSAIKRNTTFPFKFYCYTENPSHLNDNIITIPIPNPDLYKLQWHKLEFHRTGFGGIDIGEKCLILDIDWMILQNLDDVLSYELPENTFGCIRRWWSKRMDFCEINGGFQMYRMGETNHLYEKFIESPHHWQEYYINIGEAEGPVNGEQNFIDKNVNMKRSWFPMEWFAKYHPQELIKIQSQWERYIDVDPYFLGGEFDERIKMIHFSNHENGMHIYDEDWVKECWYD